MAFDDEAYAALREPAVEVDDLGADDPLLIGPVGGGGGPHEAVPYLHGSDPEGFEEDRHSETCDISGKHSFRKYRWNSTEFPSTS